MAKFTQNEAWADALRLTRSHWGALIAIAGVFNFLPTLLLYHFYPMGEPPAGAELRIFIGHMLDYYRTNAVPVTVHGFVVMIGSAAMLRLVFARGGTVGGALLYGIALLPVYSILVVLVNLAVGAGLALLIVPGLYLWGRLIPAAPAMVAEDRRNPIDALKRGFALSRGHGWLVIGFYMLVWIPAGILMLTISLVTGSAFKIAIDERLASLLEKIVLCAMQALVAILLTMLAAAIYRALAPKKPEV